MEAEHFFPNTSILDVDNVKKEMQILKSWGGGSGDKSNPIGMELSCQGGNRF